MTCMYDFVSVSFQEHGIIFRRRNPVTRCITRCTRGWKQRRSVTRTALILLLQDPIRSWYSQLDCSLTDINRRHISQVEYNISTAESSQLCSSYGYAVSDVATVGVGVGIGGVGSNFANQELCLIQCYVWVWPAKCRYTQGQPCIPVSCEEQTLCM